MFSIGLPFPVLVWPCQLWTVLHLPYFGHSTWAYSFTLYGIVHERFPQALAEIPKTSPSNDRKWML